MQPFQIDPLRLLPEERPAAFDALPPEEQAWRGRWYLMVWGMGSSSEFAWDNALRDKGLTRDYLDGVDDALIIANVRARQQEEAGGTAPA